MHFVVMVYITVVNETFWFPVTTAAATVAATNDDEDEDGDSSRSNS